MCPTCGLPAELVEHSANEATARCVLMHDFTVVIESVDLRPEQPAPAARPAPPAPTASVARLLVTPPPASREWARRLAWFCFGALAALLLTRAPLAAIVLIPLSLPLIGVEAARRSWRPLMDHSAVEPALAEPDSGEDAAAA